MNKEKPSPFSASLHNLSSGLDRRSFLKKSAIGAGMMVLPSYIVGQSKENLSPSNRLNIALVGIAGRGTSNMMALKSENIVALCDVDMARIKKIRADTTPRAQSFSKTLDDLEKRGARWFTDYREMFAEMGDQIDAVVITTPDHMHFPIALSAINLGKHVYCEKPLTHTVGESRILAAAAKKAGVITQMGNQGHSNSGARIIREWIQAGVIGQVKEVYSWTNRPIWEQGMATPPDHSAGAPEIPEGLDWNLWLGVAEPREYDPAYAPFKWRGWWDFGTGAIGDMACHVMDGAYWALDLEYPTSIEPLTYTSVSEVSPPESSSIRFHFPARGNMAPVTHTWFDGGLLPPVPQMLDKLPPMDKTGGSFIIGEDGIIQTDTYSSTAKILPENKMVELRPRFPEKTLRRIKGSHQMEWINAIRENRQATSDFSYAGPYTETALLGAIALRVGKKIDFDSESISITNLSSANQYLNKEYPKGWILS